jgi:flotillin
MSISAILIPIGIVALIIGVIVAFLCSIYRVADIDKALIITGGKEPIVKVSGGSFVIPIFRKAQYFDLCMLTVKADKDEIKTITSVPIVTDWTAQIRPDTNDPEKLKKAIISFKERGSEGIIQDVKLTLTGAVRDIVASMTPEAVLRDKAEFAQKVRTTVEDEMANMGMELVSLNIQDITDNNGYYDNIAALDMGDKRLAAENKRATVDQEVRRQKAESEKLAAQKELETELAVAERQRDNDLKKAEFKVETDKANANAQIAGELQRTIRMQEIAEQEGKVEIVRQEQANFAATKEKEVIATRAEAEKQKRQIDAEAEANVQKIDADAKVQVAEKKAHAVKIEADAFAEKTRKEGLAVADVTKQKGLAEAEVAKQKGLAEAEIIKQRGLAEAETEKAKLMAQAEGEKALADARASNDKVNFEIEKLKIGANAQIEIATKTAQVMATLGQNAEFVNIGGCATGNGVAGNGGNVLLDTLAGIPALMKTLNVQNEALNGRPMNEEVYNFVDSIVGPMKGLLVNNENPVVSTITDVTQDVAAVAPQVPQAPQE